MALKLNVNRTTRVTVAIAVETENGEDQVETFTANCNVLKIDQSAGNHEDRLIDVLLVGVEGLEMVDPKGKILTKPKTLAAVKNDSELAAAIISAWRLGNEAKLMRGRTFLEQSDTSSSLPA